MIRRGLYVVALAGALAGTVAYSPPTITKAQVERMVVALERRRWVRSSSRPALNNRGGRPGWSVAEGKRRARKRRNQLRHKAHRGSR
jgi:hypothetical protein